LNFDKLIAIFDADWDESKHPRAKNGQFGKGNGGSSAPAKEKKKSTMSKSYKALSPGQKADAKANVASQIKSMSKEKQISVANRVLKAQGKEPIVANKDGTYTWTNKGERVTTQKPPRIKSDKLARAIVSNGYAVPGIKTGVSVETAKASVKAPSLRETPDWGGGQTSTKLSKEEQRTAARYIWTSVNNVIEGQQLTYPNKSKSQINNQYRYAGNLIEERLKSGKFNSMNEVLKDIEKSKPNSDYQAAKKVAGRAAYLGLIPKGSSNGGGMTKEQLSAAGRLSKQMNSSGSDFRDYKEFTHTKLTPKLRKSLEDKLGKAEENLYQRAQKEGRNLRPSETYQVASLVKGGLRMRMGTLNEIVGTIRKAHKTGARYADIAESLLKELHDIHK
jgi:hypothetical protein